MRRWGSRERLEALFDEGAAGVGFQIFLEFERPHLVWKGAVPEQFPRFELCGVGGFTGVVLGQSSLQIGCRADVFLLGKINALDDVDVPHRCSRALAGANDSFISKIVSSPSSPRGFAGHHASSFGLRRGCATRSPKGEAWWSQAGSNRRPLACHASALPAELWPLNSTARAYRTPWATHGQNPEPQFRADLKYLRRRRRRR